MSIQNIRLEVMQFLEKKIDGFVDDYLIPVEKIWQPTDLLPDSQSENFFEEVKEIVLNSRNSDDTFIFMGAGSVSKFAHDTKEKLEEV